MRLKFKRKIKWNELDKREKADIIIERRMPDGVNSDPDIPLCVVVQFAAP